MELVRENSHLNFTEILKNSDHNLKGEMKSEKVTLQEELSNFFKKNNQDILSVDDKELAKFLVSFKVEITYVFYRFSCKFHC